MMILGLNTLGIIIETGLGIWIFSKAFPRRMDDEWGWKEVVNEAVLYLVIWLLIPYDITKGLGVFWGKVLPVIVIAFVVIYRCYAIQTMQIHHKKIGLIIDSIQTVVELLSICGILAWNSWDSYISLVMACLGGGILPFFLCKYFQCKLSSAYLWEVLYLINIQIWKCAYMVYVGASEQSTLLIMNRDGGMHTYGATVFALIVYVAIYLLVKFFALRNIIQRLLTEYRRWIISLVILEAVILNFYGDLIGSEVISARSEGIISLCTAGLVFLILILLIALIKKTLISEQRLLAVRNETMEQQYEELRRAYELNRCIIHDEKHRIQYIEECLKNEDVKRARDFIRECQENIYVGKNRTWTGMPTLDFILSMKDEKVKEAGIKFVLSSEIDEIPIEEADFVVLLGNLLDNAIEAAQKCVDQKRTIELRLKVVNNMLLLLMTNTSTLRPIERNKRFITSKQEKKGHGYGIESVKHIVNKYNGEVKFEYDNRIFAVRITMEILKEKSLWKN